jgi:hypothetical protein
MTRSCIENFSNCVGLDYLSPGCLSRGMRQYTTGMMQNYLFTVLIMLVTCL